MSTRLLLFWAVVRQAPILHTWLSPLPQSKLCFAIERGFTLRPRYVSLIRMRVHATSADVPQEEPNSHHTAYPGEKAQTEENAACSCR